jgi:hypothetical protein
MALLRFIGALPYVLAAAVLVGGGGGASAAQQLAPPHDPQVRHLQTCPSLCEDGAAMLGGDSSLPIFTDGPQTCSAVEALLAANDETACAVISTYLNFLDLGAYCMCEGSAPPELCTACADGGSIEDPDREFTVEFLNGISFSCRQGASFVRFLTSELACGGFTSTCRSRFL